MSRAEEPSVPRVDAFASDEDIRAACERATAQGLFVIEVETRTVPPFQVARFRVADVLAALDETGGASSRTEIR